MVIIHQTIASRFVYFSVGINDKFINYQNYTRNISIDLNVPHNVQRILKIMDKI